MKDFEAVVFDMDGVIFDSEKLVLRAWKEVAKKYHIPDIETICMECLGLNQTASYEKFCEKYGKDFPYEEYKKETRALFFGPFYGEHLPIKPGTEELLTFLADNHKKIALASSTRRELVVKELTDAGLIDYFDTLVCGDMVTHSKPHPEIFVTACKNLGIPVEKSYAIEDSFNGIRAAYAGNLRPIMVPDMVKPTDEILSLTEICLRSLKEVKDYLAQ